MSNIYDFSDAEILQRLGKNIRRKRLEMNITQCQLAKEAFISLSTMRNIEGGENVSIDGILKVLRKLEMLDIFQSTVDDEQLRFEDYFEVIEIKKPKERLRARSSASDKVSASSLIQREDNAQTLDE